MKKYITLYDVTFNNIRVFKVSVLEVYKNNSLILLGNDSKMSISNNDIYEDRDVAIIVAKERNIIRKFKSKYKKNRCSLCNAKIKPKSITVDHIVPKAYFKELNGGKDIRTNLELWNECWNSKNLQICCESCNKNKAASNDQYLQEIDHYARILNLNKLKQESLSHNRRVRKIGHKIPTSNKYNNNAFSIVKALEVSRKDSRNIPIELILNKDLDYNSLCTTL